MMLYMCVLIRDRMPQITCKPTRVILGHFQMRHSIILSGNDCGLLFQSLSKQLALEFTVIYLKCILHFIRCCDSLITDQQILDYKHRSYKMPEFKHQLNSYRYFWKFLSIVQLSNIGEFFSIVLNIIRCSISKLMAEQ